jgi:tetratricopeptide (TPR) repeat protein
MGNHELKGFVRSVPVWRVLGEAAAESRFAATRARGHLPFVGRTHEMGLMLDRWRLARAGEGQIVTVLGEAGIGKSCLVEALNEAVSGEPHTRIYLQCSPYHRDSALYPVIQHLGRAARFVAGDSPATRIEKLGVLFARRAASDEAAIPLLAELMSLPIGTSLSLTPAQRKTATIALLVDDIVRLGEAEPVLLVVDDAHWIDATTLELMTRVADSVAQAGLLALVTARPEFAPPWLARSHATLLTLARLGRAECAQLVANVAAQGLSAQIVAAIVAKTDGVPLFVEELTKNVMESAGEERAAVPATLKDSLMARLDRLDDTREVAQIAAVIGRQFTFSLLAAITPKSEAELEGALAKLAAAGIVFPEGRGLELSFRFKHALVRDAAYESLLLGRRREWHERIARAFEERFSELAENEPELLAYHLGEAEFAGPACDYRMRAGERAVSRAAYTEAIAHFSAALKETEKLSDVAERMRRQLEFLLKLGPALIVTRGPQSAEVEDAYRRAAEIGAIAGNDEATFKAKWGLWFIANIGNKTALARDRARELVTLAQRSGDGDLLLEAYHCRWSTAFFRGEVAETIESSRIGVERYDISRHHQLGQAFGGHDPGVCAHAICGLSYQMRGERQSAERCLARSLAIAEALDQPISLAFALYQCSLFHQLSGDRGATLASANRAASVAEKYGLLVWRSHSLVLTAWATAIGDGVAEAARVIDAEIDKTTTRGAVMLLLDLGLAAEVLLTAGRPADGLAHLDRVISEIEEPEVGFYLPEIYRLRGECLLAIDRKNKDEARQAFAVARDIADRQGALILAHRAEASLLHCGK